MEDLRLAAAEDLAAVELDRSNAGSVVDLLAELSAANPGRERLAGLLGSHGAGDPRSAGDRPGHRSVPPAWPVTTAAGGCAVGNGHREAGLETSNPRVLGSIPRRPTLDGRVVGGGIEEPPGLLGGPDHDRGGGLPGLGPAGHVLVGPHDRFGSPAGGSSTWTAGLAPISC